MVEDDRGNLGRSGWAPALQLLRQRLIAALPEQFPSLGEPLPEAAGYPNLAHAVATHWIETSANEDLAVHMLVDLTWDTKDPSRDIENWIADQIGKCVETMKTQVRLRETGWPKRLRKLDAPTDQANEASGPNHCPVAWAVDMAIIAGMAGQAAVTARHFGGRRDQEQAVESAGFLGFLRLRIGRVNPGANIGPFAAASAKTGDLPMHTRELELGVTDRKQKRKQKKVTDRRQEKATGLPYPVMGRLERGVGRADDQRLASEAADLDAAQRIRLLPLDDIEPFDDAPSGDPATAMLRRQAPIDRQHLSHAVLAALTKRIACLEQRKNDTGNPTQLAICRALHAQLTGSTTFDVEDHDEGARCLGIEVGAYKKAKGRVYAWIQKELEKADLDWRLIFTD